MNTEILKRAARKLDPMATSEFQKELTELLNRYGLDNSTDTEDYLLAEFLVNCLKAYSEVQKAKISTLLAQLQAQRKDQL